MKLTFFEKWHIRNILMSESTSIAPFESWTWKILEGLCNENRSCLSFIKTELMICWCHLRQHTQSFEIEGNRWSLRLSVNGNGLENEEKRVHNIIIPNIVFIMAGPLYSYMLVVHNTRKNVAVYFILSSRSIVIIINQINTKHH